jgi:phage gpG-like protein
MSVSVQMVGLEEIQALLKQIQDTGTNTQPVMRALGEIIRNDTMDSFESKTSPFGQSWKPSEHNLRDSGRLASFNVSSTKYTANVYTSVAYGAIHQFGGTIKPKNGKYLMFKGKDSRFAKVTQVTIPARPFMPVNASGELAPKTKESLIRYLTRKLTRLEGKT